MSDKCTAPPWRALWFETNKRCKTGHWAFCRSDGHPVPLKSKSGTAAANAQLIEAAPLLHQLLSELVCVLDSEETVGILTSLAADGEFMAAKHFLALLDLEVPDAE